jgi:hypothetical protein
MNNKAIRTFSIQKDWIFYIKMSLLYTLFYIINYLFLNEENTEILYNSFFFHFDATYSEINIWYPNFGLGVFVALQIVKLSFLIFCFLMLYKIGKIIINLYKIAESCTILNPKKYLYHQIFIFFIFLMYYILGYYLTKFYFNTDFIIFQLILAKGFLFHLIIQLVRILLFNKNEVYHYFKSYFFTPQLPYNISILRILFFSYLGFIYSFKFATVFPLIELKTKVSLPFLGWLIQILPVNSEVYSWFFYAGIVSCFFIIIGFKTRFFLLINAVCVFYLIATPNFFGKLWHEQIVIWISWFFMFSKCYDVFSIDSWLKKTPIILSSNYTFPVRFIWVQLGVIYFWAGFYKIWDAGFEWALGNSMINQVQLEWLQNYDQLPSIRIDFYPYLLHFGGIIVILFEFFYIYLVFKPSLRWIAACGGLLMHNLIGFFMNISFFTLLQVFYVFYIDFNVFFKKNICKTALNHQFSKISFFSGVVLLNINFIFGMFHIDSYPFSSYPSYSAIIPDTFKMIWFEPNNLNQTVHEVGLKNHFRWEDYGWLENNLIQDFEKGKNVKKRIQDYWDIWVNRNPQLQVCDTIEVNIVERPVAPKGQNQIKLVKKMGVIIQK